MVALNMQGQLYATHAALPHLVRSAEDSPRRVADLVTISFTAGSVARPAAGVHALTKFGAAEFPESLRQELTGQRARVSVAEPGTVDTELASHLRKDIQQAARSQLESIEPLRPTAPTLRCRCRADCLAWPLSGRSAPDRLRACSQWRRR